MIFTETEIILIVIALLLVFINLLLISVLKGVYALFEQKDNIHTEFTEWKDDILDFIYTEKKEEEKLIIGDEIDKSDMYKDGLKKLDEINKNNA